LADLNTEGRYIQNIQNIIKKILKKKKKSGVPGDYSISSIHNNGKKKKALL